RLPIDGLNRSCQLHPAPGGIVVTASVDQEVAAVVATVRIGMHNFKAVHVTDSRRVPSGAARSQRRRHGDAGFEDEGGFASVPGVHADSIVHRVAWNRLLDISPAFGAVTPPCAVGRLARVDNEAECVICYAEFLSCVLARRFDEPADRILVIPTLGLVL